MGTVKNDNKKTRSKSISIFRALGTTYKVLSHSIGGLIKGFEHTLEPNGLGAPMTKLTHENEFSCVLEGELETRDILVNNTNSNNYFSKME